MSESQQSLAQKDINAVDPNIGQSDISMIIHTDDNNTANQQDVEEDQLLAQEMVFQEAAQNKDGKHTG